MARTLSKGVHLISLCFSFTTLDIVMFQGTYEYGKQLLQAALVLRRSLRYDLEPNHKQAQRLADAWKRFSQGINERTTRINKTYIFNQKADYVSENSVHRRKNIMNCKRSYYITSGFPARI